MTEQEMLSRTKKFSLRVVKLVAALPNNNAGRGIGFQLLKADTSVGANYRSACRGRSKAEFIAKLGIVEEEADESAFWLEFIIETSLLSAAGTLPTAPIRTGPGRIGSPSTYRRSTAGLGSPTREATAEPTGELTRFR